MSIAAPPALAKETPPTPSAEPNWGEVRRYTEARLKRALIDPESAQITWTKGFQWASVKRPLRGRKWGWLGCDEVNSRNRMGGYVGSTSFYVLWDGGFKEGIADFDKDVDFAAMTCRGVPPVPLQAAFMDLQPQSSSAAVSVADELLKFADLLRQGLISKDEYEAQKQKLLAK